jgi:hypothetical protein
LTRPNVSFQSEDLLSEVPVVFENLAVAVSQSCPIMVRRVSYVAISKKVSEHLSKGGGDGLRQSYQLATRTALIHISFEKLFLIKV